MFAGIAEPNAASPAASDWIAEAGHENVSMLRTPRHLSTQFNIQTGAGVLDAEILAEKASSLGRAGQNVETALRDLRDLDATAPERPQAVKSAARAVYHYFIQRELCGFRSHADPIRQYGIPNEVLARLGAN